MSIKIEDTQMRPMSDLFSVYGKFDIRSGIFSLYSELAIKGDRIQGYVKPLFRDMSVTDLRSPKEKGVFHKLYVAAVKAASKILKNRPRQEVATQVDISGTIGTLRRARCRYSAISSGTPSSAPSCRASKGKRNHPNDSRRALKSCQMACR